MNMRFGVVGNTSKPVVREVACSLIDLFRKNKLEFVVHDELGRWLNGSADRSIVEATAFCKASEIGRHADMLIALGGDGTMLAAAHMIGGQGTPILGINLGKLGFLAEVSVNEV
ncbi:MAG TPA: NAD(+)/NADH kinase, partial [Bacteroidota bacterium]|nr:NAD(+)/NADH kinase [Bacteroidota bacterium]